MSILPQGLQQNRRICGHFVKLLFFRGCSLQETAQVLGVSRATAQRHWAYARACLHAQLREGAGTADLEKS
jgi:DNA-directed RNA polymerase specialized sigma24 family protein